MLTEHQWEVLSELAIKKIRNSPSRHWAHFGKYVGHEWHGTSKEGWYMPLEFGGYNGSHHSATAKALAKKGLVDRYKNGRVNTFNSRNKGACLYRISEAGLKLYESEKLSRNQ